MQLLSHVGGYRGMKKYMPPADIMKLKELTGQFAKNIDLKNFKLIDGRDAPVRNLMRRDEVAVADVGIPKDGIFPRHDHEAYEWLIVYHGVAQVDIDGDIYIVGPAEEMKYVIIAPGMSHKITALEKVRLVAATMPADEGFPGATGK